MKQNTEHNTKHKRHKHGTQHNIYQTKQQNTETGTDNKRHTIHKQTKKQHIRNKYETHYGYADKENTIT